MAPLWPHKGPGRIQIAEYERLGFELWWRGRALGRPIIVCPNAVSFRSRGRPLIRATVPRIKYIKHGRGIVDPVQLVHK